jgi:hypothetical protein
MNKAAKASRKEAFTQTETSNHNYRKSRERQVWKIEPNGWWPQLPGKDMPGGWDLTWKPVYDKDAKRYRWEGIAKIPGKRLCRECRKVAVSGVQRYCRDCARNRKRASDRNHISNKRVSVGKTGFSPTQAEALTNEDLKVGYYHTGKTEMSPGEPAQQSGTVWRQTGTGTNKLKLELKLK